MTGKGLVVAAAIVAATVLGALASSAAAEVSSSRYWTAFLNISYVDSERKVWHTERTETGRFSSEGPKKAAGIAVEVLADAADADAPPDNTGCTPPFKPNYPADQAWIAVVKRGGCTFNQKISNALRLNATGVLVYDSEAGGVLQNMKVESFPIPSVFTFHWKGQEILDLMRRVSPVYISLQEGAYCRTRTNHGSGGSNATSNNILYCTPHTALFNDELAKILNWNNHHGAPDTPADKKTSVLFVSISFIVLMIISLAWLVFYYVQRFRYMHAKDQLERKLCSQAKRALSIISTSVLRKDDLSDLSETCAVCIETYRVADVVRILPCKHQFHKACIDQWLLEKRTCPMCKMDILKHYGLVVEDADDPENQPLEVATGGSEARGRRVDRGGSGGGGSGVGGVSSGGRRESREEEFIALA